MGKSEISFAFLLADDTFLKKEKAICLLLSKVFFYQTATFGFQNRLCPVLPCIKITVLSTLVNLYVHDYSVPAVGPGQKSEQNRTEQNRTEQNRTEQNRTEQNRTEQNRTEQNKTEQQLQYRTE